MINRFVKEIGNYFITFRRSERSVYQMKAMIKFRKWIIICVELILFSAYAVYSIMSYSARGGANYLYTG